MSNNTITVASHSNYKKIAEIQNAIIGVDNATVEGEITRGKTQKRIETVLNNKVERMANVSDLDTKGLSFVHDSFDNPNNQWIKGSDIATSDPIIAGGSLSITSSHFKHSTVVNKECNGRNSITKTSVENAASPYPQVQNLVNDSGDLVVAWVKGDNKSFNVSTYKDGHQDLQPQIANVFSNETSLKIVTKVFSNKYFALLTDQDEKVLSVREYSNIDQSLYGVKNGIGNHVNTAVFTDYTYKNINKFINIVCLGDSQTAGNNLAEKEKYVNQLNSLFLDNEVSFSNKGISGNKAPDISARLQADLFDLAVDGARNIATLMVGTNDLNGGVHKSVQDTFNNIVTLCNEIKNEGWELVLMTVPVRNNGITGINTKIQKLNKKIYEGAHDLGVQVIDLWEIFVDPENEELAKTGYLQADNLHFTGLACEKVATKIANEVPCLASFLGGDINSLKKGLLIPYNEVHTLSAGTPKVITLPYVPTSITYPIVTIDNNGTAEEVSGIVRFNDARTQITLEALTAGDYRVSFGYTTNNTTAH